MKRNYLYKHATYNVILKNFQDEFLRNMLFNLYKNGSVSLSNSKDFFDEGVSTEEENRAILGDIYNLLINTKNRSIELLGNGEVENVTVSLNEHKQDADKQDVDKQDVDKQDVEEKPAKKKRGRPKGSKRNTKQ